MYKQISPKLWNPKLITKGCKVETPSQYQIRKRFQTQPQSSNKRSEVYNTVLYL